MTRRSSEHGFARRRTARACTSCAASDARVIYVGKASNVRNRLRSWFSGVDALAAAHPSAHRECLRLRGDRVPERARGPGPREHAHQAASPALQRAPEGRQELSLPQDSAPRRARCGRSRDRARGGAQTARQERRGGDAVPEAVLHAQGDPRRRALLRAVHQRAVVAHHGPLAAHHLSVPHLQRRDLPARRSVPRLSHQAVLGAVRGQDRRSRVRPDPRAGTGIHGGQVGHAARRVARPDGRRRRQSRLRARRAFSRPPACDRADQRTPDGAARRAHPTRTASRLPSRRVAPWPRC